MALFTESGGIVRDEISGPTGGPGDFADDRPIQGPLTQAGTYTQVPLGPLVQTPEQAASQYNLEQFREAAPGAGQAIGALAGILGGDPTGAISYVKDLISASGQSRDQTIQHLIDTGLDPAAANDLYDYSVSSGGAPSGFSTGPGDHDGQTTASYLDPTNVSGGSGGPTSYGSMEEYIRSITPQAQDILRGGTESALTREQQALQESLGLLDPYAGSEAFSEISALTGAMGEQAQREAISGIPISDTQRAMMEREQRQQMRLAGAKGRAGGGATIQEMINLGGAQQARTVGERINALQPISDINRQTASTLAGLEEGSLTRQAQLEQQLGPQLAAILLGQTGPITETRSTAAELSGLQNVNEAQQNAQLMSQIAEMIGSWGGSSAN